MRQGRPLGLPLSFANPSGWHMLGMPFARVDRCISLCRSVQAVFPWATRPLYPNSLTAYSVLPLSSFARKTRAVDP